MITVFLAETDAATRNEIRSALGCFADSFHIVDEASDVERLTRSIQSVDIDVMLIDLDLLRSIDDGAWARLREQRPDLNILARSRRPCLSPEIDCIEGRTLGCVTSDHSAGELRVALSMAATGQRYVNESLARMVRRELVHAEYLLRLFSQVQAARDRVVAVQRARTGYAHPARRLNTNAANAPEAAVLES